MNPYQLPVNCDVCGGVGVTTIKHAGSQWLGIQLRHTDPQVCANILRRKAQEIKKREEELGSKLQPA